MISQRLTGDLDEAAELLAILGNGRRLAIIGYLLDEEMSVGAIAAKVSLSQSALSQHLAKLRALGLVQTRRDRQMIYYSCNSEAARRIMEALEQIFGGQGHGRPRRWAAESTAADDAD
jgi:DNA-binding transcriptional ArsR family regulator